MASHYQILSSEYVPLVTVKKVLKKKKKEEMTYEQKMALEHAEEFSKVEEKEASKIINDLKALNIAKLKEELIIKIVDVMPQNRDELKLILSASKLSFKDEELDLVLKSIKA